MPPEPKVRRLERALGALVERLAPHAPLPSERALMERHQVSRDTVRRALERLVAAHLIVRRPPHGTFVAPPRRGRTVLFVSHDSLPVSGVATLLPPFLFAFLGAVRAADSTLLPAHCSERQFLSELKNLHQAYPDLSAVVLFNCSRLLAQTGRNLPGGNLPLIVFGADEVPLPPGASGLLFREAEVVGSGLDALRVAAGDEVAWWGPRDYPAVRYRHEVFLGEAAARRFKVIEMPGETRGVDANVLTPLGRNHPMFAWLSRRRRPLSVFCSTDGQCVQFIHAALAAGKRVPGEVRVVGVEGAPLGELAAVPATAVRLPVAEAGARCVAHVLDRLGGGAPKLEWLPVTLVRRGSA